jgi:DNA-binding NarL/FixJ family response regulator
MKILVADAQTLFRQALAQLLQVRDDVSAVSQAGSAQDALLFASQHHIDAAVIDLDLPGGPVERTVESLDRKRPGVHVIFVTGEESDELPGWLRGRGHEHIVSKRRSARHLVRALHEGCDVPVQTQLLTPREAEVLTLLEKALTNQQIAVELGVRPATVKRHVSNLFTKLGAVSRLNAVVIGHERGML